VHYLAVAYYTSLNLYTAQVILYNTLLVFFKLSSFLSNVGVFTTVYAIGDSFCILLLSINHLILLIKVLASSIACKVSLENSLSKKSLGAP
jgi:hypothetical protein